MNENQVSTGQQKGITRSQDKGTRILNIKTKMEGQKLILLLALVGLILGSPVSAGGDDDADSYTSWLFGGSDNNQGHHDSVPSAWPTPAEEVQSMQGSWDGNWQHYAQYQE